MLSKTVLCTVVALAGCASSSSEEDTAQYVETAVDDEIESEDDATEDEEISRLGFRPSSIVFVEGGDSFDSDTTNESEPAAPPPPPSTCTGSACNGRDPDSYGCKDDASTLVSRERDNVCVKLRYSATCNAYWSYVYRRHSSKGCDDKGAAGYIGIRLEGGLPDSDAIATIYSASSSSAVSLKTGMYYDSSLVFSACGRGKSDASWGSGCTTFTR